MKIFVFGGAGFIGSHTMVELLNEGHDVICIDNLYNSKLSAIKNVEKITNKKVKFYKIDCCNKNKLETIFKKQKKIDACIMFQGYKSVSESVNKPLDYYYNNIFSVLNILELMKKYKICNVIFSSSATVYGINSKSPISETDRALELNSITNPYGETKAMIEKILMDFSNSNKKFRSVILRYFNPVGAHKSGLIGESPNGIPNNLMPYVAKVATHKLKVLNIYGNDYNTVDGTGVRDYIHIEDLAKGHVAALKCFNKNFKYGNNVFIYNLGTGKGTSVLELVKKYEESNKVKLKFKIVDRRSGDVAKLYCNPSKAKRELSWTCNYNIYDMCKSSYNYEKRSK